MKGTFAHDKLSTNPQPTGSYKKPWLCVSRATVFEMACVPCSRSGKLNQAPGLAGLSSGVTEPVT